MRVGYPAYGAELIGNHLAALKGFHSKRLKPLLDQVPSGYPAFFLWNCSTIWLTNHYEI
jgi:hypothetical protein